MANPGEVWIAPTGTKPNRRVIVIAEEVDGLVGVVSGMSTPPSEGLPGHRNWTLLRRYRPGDWSGIHLANDTYFYAQAVEEISPRALKTCVCRMNDLAAVDLMMAFSDYLWRTKRVRLTDRRSRPLS